MENTLNLRNAFILAWILGILTALTVAMIVFSTTPDEMIWIPRHFTKAGWKEAYWAWAPAHRAIGWGQLR